MIRFNQPTYYKNPQFHISIAWSNDINIPYNKISIANNNSKKLFNINVIKLKNSQSNENNMAKRINILLF